MKKTYIKPKMRVIDSPELLYSTGMDVGWSGARATSYESKYNSLYEEEEEESWCEDPRLVTGFEVPGL